MCVCVQGFPCIPAAADASPLSPPPPSYLPPATQSRVRFLRALGFANGDVARLVQQAPDLMEALPLVGQVGVHHRTGNPVEHEGSGRAAQRGDRPCQLHTGRSCRGARA